jgi:hypothetical protein
VVGSREETGASQALLSGSTLFCRDARKQAGEGLPMEACISLLVVPTDVEKMVLGFK